MKRTMFSKDTPAKRGRISVTIEFDAVYVREMLQMYADAPTAISENLPRWKLALERFVEFMDNLK